MPASLSHRLATLDLTAVDAAELSSIVAEEALQALGGRRAVVWFNRPALGALVLEQRERDVRSMSLDDAMTEVVLEHPGPAWRPQPGVPDARTALAEGSFGPAIADAAEVAGLPLRSGRGVVGVLLVDGMPDVPDGAAEFADQVASVVANHDVLTASRRHELQLEALYRTAGELSSKLELPAVLEAIVERSRLLVNSAISYIMLVDQEHSEIYMRVASGVTHQSFNGLRLSIGGGLGGRAAERRQAFYTSDYLNDDRFTHFEPVDAEVRKEGIKCILGTPLHASGEFVGVLFVADRMVRVFSDAEVEIVASLARHAALAIENASLYERTSRALETVREANRTAEERNRRLRRVDEAHQRLSEALLNEQGLPGIVAVMTDLAGGAHVVVLDERHRILASAGQAADPFGDILARAGLRPDAARERDVQGVLAAAERYASAVLPRQEGGRTVDRLVVPVVARAELLGTVWAAIDPERLGDDRPLIEQAARVVALELLKERSVMDTERRLRRELLDELLAERALADEGLPRRARDVGVDLVRPHRLVVCAASAAGTPAREQQQRRDRDEIIAALRRQPWCAFVAERGSRVVALLDDEERRPEQELTRVLDLAGCTEPFRAVVSPPCTHVGQYRAHFIAGTRVLTLLGAGLQQRVLALDEVRVLMLLFGEGREADVRAFLDAQLGPLLERTGGTALVHTLRAWLDCGSPGRAATALHVHVNTVYYRLERLREILGDDFDEPRRALDLRVALLAHRLLHDLEDPYKVNPVDSETLSVLRAVPPT